MNEVEALITTVQGGVGPLPADDDSLKNHAQNSKYLPWLYHSLIEYEVADAAGRKHLRAFLRHTAQNQQPDELHPHQQLRLANVRERSHCSSGRWLSSGSSFPATFAACQGTDQASHAQVVDGGVPFAHICSWCKLHLLLHFGQLCVFSNHACIQLQVHTEGAGNGSCGKSKWQPMLGLHPGNASPGPQHQRCP